MEQDEKLHYIRPIAYIESDFKDKFGIPRQSGIVNDLVSKIVFEREYRDTNALRGLEGFSHIWLIWLFSENSFHECFPTVRPPRFGGDERIGIFATRSPFRPNSLGLSCVEIDHIELHTANGPVIFVKGADLMNGTPIFDIKPYIAFTDSKPNAVCSFAKCEWERSLDVLFPDDLLNKIKEEKRKALIEVLAQDPRPAYKKDSEQIYHIRFSDYDVGFVVENRVLKVVDVRG